MSRTAHHERDNHDGDADVMCYCRYCNNWADTSMLESRPLGMTEKQLQTHVIDAARKLGWTVFHPWISVNSASGYPDLTLTKDGRLIVAELKRDGKDPTPAQQRWLNEFAAVPCCEVHIWRPADWYSGLIVDILTGEAAT